MRGVRPGARMQIVLIVVGLFVFATLATLALGGELRRFDQRVLQAVDNERTAALTAALRAISFLGKGAVVGIATALIGLLLWRTSQRSALFLALAVGGSGVLNQLLKSLFERRRPESLGAVLYPDGYAFPSGHAMGTMALVVALWLVAHRLESRLRWMVSAVGVPFVVAVGASRVYLGVHYPSDVVAGWALASAWVLLVDLSFQHGATGPRGAV